MLYGSLSVMVLLGLGLIVMFSLANCLNEMGIHCSNVGVWVCIPCLTLNFSY
eukprot:c19635_g1_i1 orf=3-155(-)